MTSWDGGHGHGMRRLSYHWGTGGSEGGGEGAHGVFVEGDTIDSRRWLLSLFGGSISFIPGWVDEDRTVSGCQHCAEWAALPMRVGWFDASLFVSWKEQLASCCPPRAIRQSLGGRTVYSKLDLRNGFCNIPLAEDSRKHTGFVVSGVGTFEWNVLPQGHRCSPGQFQRIMEHVLAEEIRSGAVIDYLGDIIIATHSREAHWVDVEAVLRKLRSYGLAEDKVVLGSVDKAVPKSIIRGGTSECPSR
ncbi:RNA-directed DNA polymerase [Gregarina niphandrodes]|uniref:RNA-directed DNA polymerase n=1 Tax=Gregarina niphandrodes TaxID=110365 RepID=A0A023AXU5_GRENI|nr:RNA-directed DNA polymerase [Gregarina niphandrodes]EZG43288.1 RNA-directed DNA polymerase [Gregarina niphandrodes]|eukprot:XP_011133454.1 RNA-directed DNA polymerase [Gregarina niphandrodes]